MRPTDPEVRATRAAHSHADACPTDDPTLLPPRRRDNHPPVESSEKESKRSKEDAVSPPPCLGTLPQPTARWTLLQGVSAERPHTVIQKRTSLPTLRNLYNYITPYQCATTKNNGGNEFILRYELNSSHVRTLPVGPLDIDTRTTDP